ncbi:MAG: glycosyl hydrolase [Rubrivivax sp.]|nr:glycosyl hydrolase [Rubrivivax sp.]
MNRKLCLRLLCAAGLLAAAAAGAQPVKVGAGAYVLAPKSGAVSPPAAPGRTEAMLKRAAPTNQWYSTLIFNPQPEAIYAQPLSVKATAGGLEMALPGKKVVPTERRDVLINYPHAEALLISPVAFKPGPPKLAAASDWAIDISMANGADAFTATVAHGSPYVFFRVGSGALRVNLPAAAERLAPAADARMLALRLKDKHYALFGPTGVRWEAVSPTEWVAHLPAGKGYLSAAALPDDKAETLALFQKHAYAFLKDTQVSWRYDAAKSTVETTYRATTEAMEGDNPGPLQALYPHHWHGNASLTGKLGSAYDTVRGQLKLLAASQFQTTLRYTGFVPWWPGVKEGPKLAELKDLLTKDVRKRRELIPMRENNDNWRTSAYWQGKGLTRATQLASVAEVQGDLKARDQLLELARERMQFWFSGEGARSYFHFDKRLGTVVGYPDEFFSVEQMNDHHFHYGYFIRAAAEVGLRDPAWAAKSQWGGMVDVLVADIATAERGRADFPFLRNFDPYEGHSWASGVGMGEYGNNQESSSEAINAWAGLILWAEVSGNTALRDLGIYMYATESEAIAHYWFDIHGLVFAPEYRAHHVEASMLFGSTYAHNTWWTDEPRQIKGINLLPMATFSTHLARDKAYIQKNLGTLPGDTQVYLGRGKNYNEVPKDIWQDVFAKYLALADPDAALKQWDPWGAVEGGETRTHTLHWMLALQAMGTPDLSVTADTPLFQVFKRADGRKTYLAFNAGKTPLQVTFSDGKQLTVAPGQLGRAD